MQNKTMEHVKIYELVKRFDVEMMRLFRINDKDLYHEQYNVMRDIFARIYVELYNTKFY